MKDQLRSVALLIGLLTAAALGAIAPTVVTAQAGDAVTVRHVEAAQSGTEIDWP